MRAASLFASTALVLAGCGPEPDAHRAALAASARTAAASAPATPSASATAVDAADLLAGGPAAAALPERAVDDGATFDLGLKDKIAPRHWPASVTFGEMTINGALSNSAVDRVFQENLHWFKGCYEGGLDRDPDIGGELVVGVVIDRTGKVTRAKEDKPGHFSDRGVAACILGWVEDCKFPAREHGEVRVRLPIVLRTKR